jgi:hypothetical protein
MTSLLMNGSAALPAMAVGLRFWLARLGALIDRAVSARAARAVPEWQMRQVQSDIRRYLRQIRHAGR